MQEKSVSRRGFVKGGALAGIAAAGALTTGALAGCSPSGGSSASETAASGDVNKYLASEPVPDFMKTGTPNYDEYVPTYAFEIPPAPIADDEIVEELEAEVVICGAGISGSVAALTCGYEGASVIVLQKDPEPVSQGTVWKFFGNKERREAGIVDDPIELANDLYSQAYGRADAWLIKSFCEHIGEAIDYVNDVMNEVAPGEGNLVPFSDTDPTTPRGTWNDENTVDYYHMFPSMPPKIKKVCEEHFDVKYYCSTPAEQLIQDESGKVVGVIAKGPDGYIKVNATKGVMLCTGDIGNNLEMMAKYQPDGMDVFDYMPPSQSTGDGHKMGLWVGGKMEKNTFSHMIHYDPSALPEGGGPFSENPYLAVNKYGERFGNEDMPYPMLANANCLQPESLKWHILDADYAKYWDKMPNDVYGGWTQVFRNRAGYCRVGDKYDFADLQECWDACLEGGVITQGDTLEELAKNAGIEGVETFVETCERYQSYVEAGKDGDFGKNPEILALTPVKTPPFYAIKRLANNLTVLGGFWTTKEYQVLNNQDQPIEGLWCAGNVVGRMFGYDYSFKHAGISICRAGTTGYVAAKAILGVLDK